MNKRIVKSFKPVLIITAFTLCAIVIGFFVGNYILFSARKKPNYNTDIATITETIDDIAYIESEKAGTRVASDAFIIAEHKLKTLDYYKISGEGLVATNWGKIGSLKLWGSAKKENGIIQTSIISYNSLISKYQIGMKYDYDIEDASIEFYKGQSKPDGTVSWKSPFNMTPSEYKDEWGFTPDTFFTYVISSKTALDNDRPEILIVNNQILYSYSISLDTELAVGNYAKQLQKMSTLDNAPVFSMVEFSFVVNEDYVLQSVIINECYSVYIYGVLMECDSTISYIFEY